MSSWTYTPGVYNPPPDALYAEVKVSEELTDELMYRVIGKEGIAFKAITHLSGSDYIWWNKEKNVIEIWAYYHQALASSWVRLRERMQRIIDNDITSKIAQFEKETHESFSKFKIVFGTFDENEILPVA